MTIAIDYDDTYTRDPGFWDQVIALAQHRGHAVICVTSRTAADTLGLASLAQVLTAVIFAGATPKREAARAMGYDVSVWIDDMPETIGVALLVGAR